MLETTKQCYAGSRARFVAMYEGGAISGIVLADTQAIYRAGILEVLEAEIDMRVVAQADTLAGVHGALQLTQSSCIIVA